MNVEEQQFLNALVDRHLLDRDLLNVRRNALESVVRDKGFTRGVAGVFGLREDVLADALSEVFKWGRMKIAVEIGTAPEQLLTEEEILRFRALPIFLIGLELTMAFIDPPSRQVVNHLQQLTGHRVLPVFTTISDFEAAMKSYHGAIDRIQALKSTIALEKYDIKDQKGRIPSL